MSLLSFPSSEEQNTIDAKATRTADQIKKSVRACFQTMTNTYNQNYNFIWQNMFGLTPSQVVSGLGSDAGEVFALAPILANVLNSAVSGTISNPTIPSGYSLVVNLDQTATITKL